MKFLLDPGHSGLAFGHYTTAGKRSPEIPPGFYEGAMNRTICDLICNHAATNYEVLNINPGPINIPLQTRIKFVNQLIKQDGDDFALISIHCNAGGKPGWSKSNGFVVFKPRISQPEHNTLAGFVHSYYKELDLFYDRGIKEASFAMIRKPKCPGVLLEMGFMTNKEDVRKLHDPMNQLRIARAIVGAMYSYAESMI